MGQDGQDCVSRVIASGFSNLGFDVNLGPLLSTMGEVTNLAADSNLHVIGVLSQADGHLSLLPALRDDLRTRRRRRRTREGGGGGGEDEGGTEEEEGEEENNDMVVATGGSIPTRDHDFLLRRGENDGDEDSRCCDAIFGPRTCITTTAVEVLSLISDKKVGGRR